MSAVPLSMPSTLDRLAAGVSRISVRHSSGRTRYRKPKPEMTGWPEGHGEKIWIFAEVRSKMVAYSHSPVLNVYKTFKQIPFTAKKARPAKIRKDLWKPVALVQFPSGKDAVGRSVFAKLREFHSRHLLEWGDELLFADNPDGTGRRSTTKLERGKKILEQKANAVADLAAVLGGAGKSNRIKAEAKEGEEGELCEATVYWTNAMDRHHAEKWTGNVRHGLLPNGVDWSAEHGSLTPSTEYTLLPGETNAPAKVEA